MWVYRLANGATGYTQAANDDEAWSLAATKALATATEVQAVWLEAEVKEGT